MSDFMQLTIRAAIAFLGILFLASYINNTPADCAFIFIAGMFSYGVASFDFYLVKYVWAKFKE